MITRADVHAAEGRIRPFIRRTPMVQVSDPASPLWFKCEYLQHTGTFKARGAFNRILRARETGELDDHIGVVAASGGNAGLANAFAAARLGVPATVFVPTTAPQVKVERLRSYGAAVRQVGVEYVEAYAAAVDFADETKALFCHAYDQVEIAAGAGTMAEEMLLDEPALDTVILAVGGGGMLAGVLAGLDRRARVVAAEPSAAPTLHEALAAGKPVDVAVSGVAADSLGARRVGSLAFEIASRSDLTSVLVEDADILAARARLWADYRIAAEHGAAAAFAALTSGAYLPSPGERVAVIICGANTDPSSLAPAPAEDTP